MGRQDTIAHAAEPALWGNLLGRASNARRPGGAQYSLRRRWPWAMIDDMREIEVVVAHSERVTLRVGDVFLKIDTEQARIDREVEVMARAPIPTPEVLWRKPPVLVPRITGSSPELITDIPHP